MPLWPPSLPVPYVERLRSAGNLFSMIASCLETTVDSSAAKMQSQYIETVDIAGITQANLPPGLDADANQSEHREDPGGGPHDDRSQAPIPTRRPRSATAPSTCPHSILWAETRGDTDRATTLFAARAVGIEVFDYMVTAPYVLPGGFQILLAALSQPAAAVQTADDFSASLLATHAVVSRDTAAQIAVELTWQPPSPPQAYGLLASRAPGHAVVLNTPRKSPMFGYNPYLGLAPPQPVPGKSPADALPNFKDAAGHLPITGNAVTKYLAAGIDVFGRWSPWTPASVSLAAAAVTQPGLRQIVFSVGKLPSSGTVVPYTLSIEVAWDWTDRSPGVIRITGRFVGAHTHLGPAYLSGLALSNDGAPGAPLLLTWDYGANDPATIPPDLVLPTINSAHTGTVVLANDPPKPGDPPTKQMRYRVTITKGVNLDFGVHDRLYLAVYATACERIRPGEWSSPIDPNAPTTNPPTPAISAASRA